MAYAVIDKELAKVTTKKNAFIARVNGIKKENLRLFEKDFVMIPWDKWLVIKEEEG